MEFNPEVVKPSWISTHPRKHLPLRPLQRDLASLSNESYQELMDFKIAAKRDISAFDILKDEKYYDDFTDSSRLQP